MQTDREIHARIPDIVLMDGENNQCFIIDVAIPEDARVTEKEMEKVEKYQDLRREVARLLNIKVTVVPVVIGALGIVSGKLASHLKTVGVTTKIELLQKAALLGKERLLKKVLEA